MDASLKLSLDEVGADGARRDVLHRQLRDELRHADHLDLGSPTSTVAATPDGARALGPAEISALSVAVLGSGGLPTLFACLRDWLRRGQQAKRSIRLEIDGDVIVLDDPDDAERQELLRTFLSRHGIEESI
ncbi:hypothetical protein [Intrasporangium sp. DVR]|uniref:effector-associated constant component EACC1 n=1 Tax=Intrasporangium sp. DVR TaxID=3127867 RepID=UPI00313A6922